MKGMVNSLINTFNFVVNKVSDDHRSLGRVRNAVGRL